MLRGGGGGEPTSRYACLDIGGPPTGSQANCCHHEHEQHHHQRPKTIITTTHALHFLWQMKISAFHDFFQCGIKPQQQ